MLSNPDTIPLGSSIDHQVVRHHELKLALAHKIDEWEKLHHQMEAI